MEKKPKATFTVEFFFHHFELQSGRVFLGGDQDEEANRTCHLCAQLWTIGLPKTKGERRGKKTFENLQDFAYIDQDEWKSNNLEKGGVKDQMKRRKKAQIVKLV